MEPKKLKHQLSKRGLDSTHSKAKKTQLLNLTQEISYISVCVKTKVWKSFESNCNKTLSFLLKKGLAAAYPASTQLWRSLRGAGREKSTWCTLTYLD